MMHTTYVMEMTGEMPAPARGSLDHMPTLVRDPPPADSARRRAPPDWSR
jgi:hypothetical protein